MELKVEDDAVVDAQPRLTSKEYPHVIKRLSDNLIKKDVRKIVFLCHEFVKDKTFLARKDLTALELFTEMTRNGTISREKVTVLSQIMHLIGKKKLQKEELTSRGIPAWNPKMKSLLSNFRHLLYKLYQDIRTKDLDTMKQQCLLSGKLTNADVRDIGDALDLFTTLIDNQVITSDDIDFLCWLVKEIHNVKIDELIATYKESFVSHQERADQNATNPGSEGKSPNVSSQHPLYSRLSSTNSTDTYMDERSCGPSLKGPDQFSMKQEPKDHILPAFMKTYDAPSSEGSEETQLDEKRDETCKGDLPASVDIYSGPSSEGSEQTRLDKKTDEIEGEIKKVGAGGGDENYGVRHPPEGSTSDEMEVTTSFAHIGIAEGSLDKKDFNLTARTEAEQDQLDEIRMEDQAASKLTELSEMSETERQEDAKLKKLEEKEEDLDSSESDEPSELQQQEEEKLRKAKEKEKGLESLAPVQESSGAAGQMELSTLSMIQQDLLRPKLSRYPSEDVYPMGCIPRGKCLLLMYDEYDDPKHKRRRGNEIDMKKLHELFDKVLRFTVIEQHNKTLEETKAIINKVRKMKDHGDCFICCVCSHGNGEAFLTRDGEWLRFQELYDNFTPEKCKALTAKPKVFFMNACLREENDIKYQTFIRGSGSLSSDGPESIGIGAKERKLSPKHADFCISYSTIAGYSSARHKTEGTFFVQNVYKIFKDHHKKKHLLDLLTKVRQSTTEQLKEKIENYGIAQESPDYNTLHKNLYFY